MYSPYVILNRTGLELDVRSKTFMGQAKSAAGQAIFANTEASNPEKAKPFMFSFPTDDQKNRALLKVGDSGWSKPQSFDAIGSDISVSVPATSGRSELHVGVSIAQGEGKVRKTRREATFAIVGTNVAIVQLDQRSNFGASLRYQEPAW